MKMNCLLPIGASDHLSLRFLPDDQSELITGGVNVGLLRRRRAAPSPPNSLPAATGSSPSSSPALGNQSVVILSNVNIFQFNYVFNLIFGNGNSILNVLGNHLPIG